MSDKVLFVLQGRQYRFHGWLGCQLMSTESGRIPTGTMRHILKRPFYVFSVYRQGFRRYETNWSLLLPDDLNAAHAEIEALREELRKLI